ncbi:MAG: hypothetical protein WDA22_05360 [Bacteroidota bacterium]
MPIEIKISLEDLIRRVFSLIDGQIQVSSSENVPFPYYDLNEMIKIEFEQIQSPLRLSIKFKNNKNKYGSECDITGNLFAMLWMYKHRKQISDRKKDPKPKFKVQCELYDLWLEDYQEVEEIDMNSISTIDAYTINKKTKKIFPLKF